MKISALLFQKKKAKKGLKSKKWHDITKKLLTKGNGYSDRNDKTKKKSSNKWEKIKNKNEAVFKKNIYTKR